MSLAEHAEAWWTENGNTVPDENTEEWKIMYELWVKFAFEEFDIGDSKCQS